MSELRQYNPEHETAQPTRTAEQSLATIEARETQERAELAATIGRYTVLTCAARREAQTLSLNQEQLRQAA